VAAAAFRAAIRIPNILQNLLGEGVLSASFIPAYARLVGEGKIEQARELAGAIFGALTALVSLLSGLGVLFAPALVDALVPGFRGEARELSIELIRILFPSTALLVLSAWCLGVLNSHRRFLLSYTAPIVWSLAQMVALWIFGGRRTAEFAAEAVAWGVMVGSALQFLVQLPPVFRSLGPWTPSLKVRTPDARTVTRAFLPVVVGRGVVQVSSLVDNAYASLISTRAVACLGYAQVISLLPISLFGMAVSAAELPEMARMGNQSPEALEGVRVRVHAGLARLSFFVIPSAVSLFWLGDVLGAALYQTGKLGPADSRYLGYLLMGSSLGLLPSTSGRLCSSALYALGDANTPFRYAIARVAVTVGLGYPAAMLLPPWLGLPRDLGAVALTALSGVAAWIEYRLLRRALERRVGGTLGSIRAARRWAASAVAVAVALALKILLTRHFGPGLLPGTEFGADFLPPPHLVPWLTAVLTLVPAGLVYLLASASLGVAEPLARLSRLRRRM
jgi:putative peptidoglycan lipid II flippase